MLSAEKITYGFDTDNPIFENISIKVEAGSIISVVGPSGVGKTTLLKCLAGILQLNKGRVLIDGEIVQGPQEQLLSGHEDIALVDQDFSLDHYFSVAENVNNRLLHLSKNDRLDFVNELLDVFGLTELKDQPSRFISGGEKQRLSMACALAHEPKYLLLDEPFSNLDVHLKKSIGDYLRQLQEVRSIGVVLVTHEGVDALSWSDYIYFMKPAGGLRKYTSHSAFYNPKSLYEGRFFGQLNSVYVEGKQIVFRPTQYSLEKSTFNTAIELNYQTTDFHGHFYANYYKLANGREVVLYADQKLDKVKEVYV